MRKVVIPNSKIEIAGFKGTFKFDQQFESTLLALLDYCRVKRGGFTTITITPPKKPRSTGKQSQCNHLNGHVRQISIETNNDFETVKMYIKKRALENGYPHEEDEGGNMRFDISGDLMPISESDASSEDAAILIETAHVVAGELQIILSEE